MCYQMYIQECSQLFFCRCLLLTKILSWKKKLFILFWCLFSFSALITIVLILSGTHSIFQMTCLSDFHIYIPLFFLLWDIRQYLKSGRLKSEIFHLSAFYGCFSLFLPRRCQQQKWWKQQSIQALRSWLYGQDIFALLKTEKQTRWLFRHLLF